MRNNKKLKKYLRLIKEIEKLRAKNNKNWMNLYRLAFAKAPKEAIAIIKKILTRDEEVSELVKKLSK
tara:strand:- start:248 stop:448 length:201 start_codon:yes stop_codon:yes gene_type:complete